MSLFTQWVPSDWNEEPHTDELQAYADRMIDCYNEVAPNFKSSIIHTDIVGPYQMEHEYGLIGGNIFHGELSLEQLFHMRPAPGFADYRTPVPGLYYASSATHAGGGVCGIPGMQAARAAIADRRATARAPEVTAPAQTSPAGRDGQANSAISAMLEARSVALVGASARPGSLGARMIAEVARSPSRPRTYLVNPRYADIDGVPCLPDLAALPEPVDLALLAVPDHALEQQLSAAARSQARSAVIFGNAFDPPGRTGLRSRLAAIAGQAGLALCGAGCMGFVNVARGLRAIGYVEPDPLPAGPVALVTHSGSVFSALLRTRRGFGFSLAVSSGQELVTTAADYARYALELAETRVLAAGPGGDQGRARAARGAGGRAGRGRAGGAAQRGRVTGRPGAGLGPLRRAGRGRRRVGGAGRRLRPAPRPRPGRAGRHPRALLRRPARGRPPRQHRHGHRHRARLRPGTRAHRRPGRRTRRAVRPPRPAGAAPGWPRCSIPDWTRPTRWTCGGPAATPSRCSPSACPRWPTTRPWPRSRWPSTWCPSSTATSPTRGRCSPRPRARPSRSRCWPGCRPPSTRPPRPGCAPPGSRSSRAPAPACSRCATCSTTPPARHPRPPRILRARPRGAGAARSPTGGAELLDLLRDYGIPAVRALPAATRTAALDAAAEIGYPVVIKTDEPGIAHKSDVGGVRLGLAGPAEAGAAYDDLAAPPGAAGRGVRDRGARHRTGPGRRPGSSARSPPGDRAGGVLVEILAERAVLLAPVTRPRAWPRWRRLRIAPVLAGSRGQPAADRRRDRRRDHRPVPPGLRPGRRPRSPGHQSAHLHPLRRRSRRRPPHPPRPLTRPTPARALPPRPPPPPPRFMIVGSFGRYMARTARDHGSAPVKPIPCRLGHRYDHCE